MKTAFQHIVNEDLESIISRPVSWSKMEGKNILITGANGMLPAYMVETILYLNEKKFKKKAKVFALVKDKQKAIERFKYYKDNKNLVFLFQDVIDKIKIRENIHFIIHAASPASPKIYGIDPVGTFLPNVFGTHNLLRLAQEKKVESFLYFSSGEIYGELEKEKIPTKENYSGYLDSMKVRSCYAESKRMGETMCACWSYQYGVPVKVIRPFHTYGPGVNLDDGRVFADFVSNIVKGENIILKSDGKARRAFCYIADATVAFFLVLLEGKNGEAYNIGNDENEVTIARLAEILVDIFPQKNLKVVCSKINTEKGYIKSEIKSICPDIKKIRKLGWKPVYDIKEGFKRTILSFD